MTPNYFTIEELFSFVDEPNGSACLNLYKENKNLFEEARGSTHNHQTWRGGISIALALSLPNMPEKQTILTDIYCCFVLHYLPRSDFG